jgi:hypothetical protein
MENKIDRPDYSQTRLTASKAIRLKCLDCCCDQITEVRMCEVKQCPLWRFRMGTEQKDILYQLSHPNYKTTQPAWLSSARVATHNDS